LRRKEIWKKEKEWWREAQGLVRKPKRFCFGTTLRVVFDTLPS
jgi:hypothetical protein